MKAKTKDVKSEEAKSLKGHVSFRNNLTEYEQSNNLPMVEDASTSSDETDVKPALKPVRRGTKVVRSGSENSSQDFPAQKGSLQIETEDDSDDSEQVKIGFYQIFKTIYQVQAGAIMKIKIGLAGEAPPQDKFPTSMFKSKVKKLLVTVNWSSDANPLTWCIDTFERDGNDDASPPKLYEKVLFKEISELFLETAPSTAFRIYRGKEVLHFTVRQQLSGDGSDPTTSATNPFVQSSSQWADAIYSLMSLQAMDVEEARYYRSMFESEYGGMAEPDMTQLTRSRSRTISEDSVINVDRKNSSNSVRSRSSNKALHLSTSPNTHEEDGGDGQDYEGSVAGSVMSYSSTTGTKKKKGLFRRMSKMFSPSKSGSADNNGSGGLDGRERSSSSASATATSPTEHGEGDAAAAAGASPGRPAPLTKSKSASGGIAAIAGGARKALRRLSSLGSIAEHHHPAPLTRANVHSNDSTMPPISLLPQSLQNRAASSSALNSPLLNKDHVIKEETDKEDEEEEKGSDDGRGVGGRPLSFTLADSLEKKALQQQREPGTQSSTDRATELVASAQEAEDKSGGESADDVGTDAALHATTSAALSPASTPSRRVRPSSVAKRNSPVKPIIPVFDSSKTVLPQRTVLDTLVAENHRYLVAAAVSAAADDGESTESHNDYGSPGRNNNNSNSTLTQRLLHQTMRKDTGKVYLRDDYFNIGKPYFNPYATNIHSRNVPGSLEETARNAFPGSGARKQGRKWGSQNENGNDEGDGVSELYGRYTDNDAAHLYSRHYHAQNISSISNTDGGINQQAISVEDILTAHRPVMQVLSLDKKKQVKINETQNTTTTTTTNTSSSKSNNSPHSARPNRDTSNISPSFTESDERIIVSPKQVRYDMTGKKAVSQMSLSERLAASKSQHKSGAKWLQSNQQNPVEIQPQVASPAQQREQRLFGFLTSPITAEAENDEKEDKTEDKQSPQRFTTSPSHHHHHFVNTGSAKNRKANVVTYQPKSKSALMSRYNEQQQQRDRGMSSSSAECETKSNTSASGNDEPHGTAYSNTDTDSEQRSKQQTQRTKLTDDVDAGVMSSTAAVVSSDYLTESVDLSELSLNLNLDTALSRKHSARSLVNAIAAKPHSAFDVPLSARLKGTAPLTAADVQSPPNTEVADLSVSEAEAEADKDVLSVLFQNKHSVTCRVVSTEDITQLGYDFSGCNNPYTEAGINCSGHYLLLTHVTSGDKLFIPLTDVQSVDTDHNGTGVFRLLVSRYFDHAYYYPQIVEGTVSTSRSRKNIFTDTLAGGGGAKGAPAVGEVGPIGLILKAVKPELLESWLEVMLSHKQAPSSEDNALVLVSQQ